jgi:hypothetical protein
MKMRKLMIEYRQPNGFIKNIIWNDIILNKKEYDEYKKKVNKKREELKWIEDVLQYLYEKYSEGEEYIYEYKLIDYIVELENNRDFIKEEYNEMVCLDINYLQNRELCKNILLKKLPYELCKMIMEL